MKPTYEQLESQLSAAREQIGRMAAESAGIRERHHFMRALAVSILEHSGGRMDWRAAMEDATDLITSVDRVYTETPATDAALAELAAETIKSALDKCCDYFDTDCVMESMGISYESASIRVSGALAINNALTEIANQLRGEASNG